MSPAPARIAAIDWLRGFVMVLMAIDHASGVFNAGRFASDSAYDLSGLGVPPRSGPLDTAQFLTRWITHLCAPTFLFLAGTSLALSTRGRVEAGASPAEIDRHLAIRGALLLVFEAAWFSPLFSAGVGHFQLFLQVLFAIGAGIWLMIPLRRLPPGVLAAAGVLWFLAGEALTRGLAPPGADPSLGLSIALVPAGHGGVGVLYPALPWLAMMALGWAFGEALSRAIAADGVAALARRCVAAGVASLALFGVVRGQNAYGNLGLLRADGSLAEWLYVSKYPPSLAFASLELGLMAIALGALMLFERSRTRVARGNPLLVLGQTALFFYLLHFHVLGVAGAVLGWIGERGLGTVYGAGLAVSAALYPLCVAYRDYKRRHPRGWAQYV